MDKDNRRDKKLFTPDERKNRKEIANSLMVVGGTLLAGVASIHPIGRAVKGIRKAVKLAGSIGNTKKADTVGNRLRQSQAIMGKSPKDKPFSNRRSMVTQDNKTASTKNPMLGTVMGTSASTKYYRTLTKAVEQGPNKFFSKGRSAKTGITPHKRSHRHGTSSYNREDGFQPNFGAMGGTSKGSLLRYKKY
jgi:hypothetical protein